MTQDRQARAQRLLTLAEETGLTQVLPVRRAKPNANPGEDYDKLFVVRNAAGIRSVELWYPVTTPPYLKITHNDRIPERWKSAIDAAAEAAASYGHPLVSRPLSTRIDGEPRRSMTLLAEALRGLDVDGRKSPATAAPFRMEAGRADTAAAQPSARDDAGPGAPAPGISTRSPRDCAALLAQIDQRILDFVEQPGNGALGARTRSYPRGGTKPVHLYAGPSELAGWRCLMVHMPHPGCLQLTKEAEPMFERELTRLLRRGLAHAAA